MVPQTFQKATELYSSQFVYCLSTSDGKKLPQFSYRIQLVEGLFTKYARVAEMQSVPGDRHWTVTQFHGWLKDIFWEKWHPKLKNQNLREVCVCPKHGKKKTSVYCCQICDVGLCLEDCFELYHTKLHYWGSENYFTASIVLRFLY